MTPAPAKGKIITADVMGSLQNRTFLAPPVPKTIISWEKKEVQEARKGAKKKTHLQNLSSSKASEKKKS